MTTMADLAVILKYSTAVWGASKTDKAVSQEVLTSKHAEEKSGKFTKYLLGGTCLELEVIRLHVHQFQTWLRTNTFPSDMMGRGSCIVPNGKLMDICKECRRYENEFAVLVQNFIDKYDDIVIEAKRKLADLATDQYPSKELVRTKFSFSWFAMPIPPSSNFDGRLGLSELEEVLANQYSQQLNEALEEGESHLRNMLKARILKFHTALVNYKGEGRGSGAALSQAVISSAFDEITNVKSLNFRNHQDINQWCENALILFSKSAKEYRTVFETREWATSQAAELLISMGETINVLVPIINEEELFSYAGLL